MSVTIYHNPRCSKSRQTLALLQQRGIAPEVILYLKTPPSVPELTALLKSLALPPRALLRTHEPLCKSLDLDNPNVTDAQLLEILSRHPELIERPIVIHNDQARIGRPPEAILEIL